MTASDLTQFLTSAAKLQLGVGNLAVLAHLHSCPGHTDSMTGIAQAVGISTAAITGQVDRLDGYGLVTRRPNLTDRRGVFAALTPQALDMFQNLLTTSAPAAVAIPELTAVAG
jgi:DNA-binding MarR family transcriptional regulator